MTEGVLGNGGGPMIQAGHLPPGGRGTDPSSEIGRNRLGEGSEEGCPEQQE